MRVLVFSSFQILGECLVQWLERCEVVSAAAFCPRADSVALTVAEFAADTVLFEIRDASALEEARLVVGACQGVRLLALAIPETTNDVIACADAGFVGYVSTNASLDELADVMKQTRDGEFACNAKIAAGLVREVRRRRPALDGWDLASTLTPREGEVLAQVARGLSNKEIAGQLGVSVATVKNHLHNIFTKLHVQGRTQALARVRSEPWLVRSA